MFPLVFVKFYYIPLVLGLHMYKWCDKHHKERREWEIRKSFWINVLSPIGNDVIIFHRNCYICALRIDKTRIERVLVLGTRPSVCFTNVSLYNHLILLIKCLSRKQQNNNSKINLAKILADFVQIFSFFVSASTDRIAVFAQQSFTV